jgi:hypothetical protein
MKKILAFCLLGVISTGITAQEIVRDDVDPLQQQRVIQIPEAQITSDGSSVAIDCIIDLHAKTDTFYYLNFYIKTSASFVKDQASTIQLHFNDGSVETFSNLSTLFNNAENLPGEIAASCSPAPDKWRKIANKKIVKVIVTLQSETINIAISHSYRKVIPSMANVMYRYVD